MAARKVQSKSKPKSKRGVSPKHTPLLQPGWIAFSVLLLLIIAFGAWKRNWVLAAWVNNKPIWGFEVLNNIDKNYHNAEVGELINRRVILGEAKKKNALPTKDEVQARLKEQETKYGGAQAFDQLLQQYGKTREQVSSDIKLQLAMEKMYGSEVAVTDQEIDTYVKENKTTLTATDSAGQKEEAKNQLTSQKQQEVFSKHFSELKTAAKVKIF